MMVVVVVMVISGFDGVSGFDGKVAQFWEAGPGPTPS